MKNSTLVTLQAAVLPWAKEHHPEKYDMTLKVASNEKSFRAYLIRLLEIRWQEDVANRGQLPVLALEETSLVVRARRGEEVLEFCGRGVKPRQRAIAELAMPKEDWQALEETRKILDLEYV